MASYYFTVHVAYKQNPSRRHASVTGRESKLRSVLLSPYPALLLRLESTMSYIDAQSERKGDHRKVQRLSESGKAKTEQDKSSAALLNLLRKLLSFTYSHIIALNWQSQINNTLLTINMNYEACALCNMHQLYKHA